MPTRQEQLDAINEKLKVTVDDGERQKLIEEYENLNSTLVGGPAGAVTPELPEGE